MFEVKVESPNVRVKEWLISQAEAMTDAVLIDMSSKDTIDNSLIDDLRLSREEGGQRDLCLRGAEQWFLPCVNGGNCDLTW